MVDGELFDKLAAIGGLIRGKPNEPFGGIQVNIYRSILVGLSNQCYHVACRHGRFLPAATCQQRKQVDALRFRSHCLGTDNSKGH